MSDLRTLDELVEEEEIIAVPLDEVREWEKKFREARRRRREAQAEEEEAKEFLKEYFEENGGEFGSVGGHITLRYRSMTVRRLNVKKLRKDYPELADAYTEANEERRMEVVEDDE